ncbi:MAG: glucose-1-phosphate adenylyltransferase [Eubacteriales bacterium]|jgi:glucose-1-phosphate adenylyltransferase
MIAKKKCVAMLLAGGQGSRLYALTTKRAKPAVPYGGKYRIIDFPLSNCTNSGIDTVGVLTQYEPLELNAYIGNGAPWDLDGMNGGAFVLPPYVKGKKGEWYAGTANAIYQNINFIDRYDPDVILVLSGDQICKMDYAKMIAFHNENNADCTIAVIEVPMEEASRFGIMNADKDQRIIEFEEKPAHPKSNTASMGIYVFNWKKIRQYLIEDEADPNSDKDFGKNIIPKMLANGERMFAYIFEGYWRDVGTIDSLWEANMELLAEQPELDLYDENFKVFTRNFSMPAHYISEDADVTGSIIGDGCLVEGTVKNSVLFPGVVVEKGCTVTDSILMQETVLKEGCTVHKAIVDEGGVIGKGAVIGGGDKITVLGMNAKVAEGATVEEGAMIAPDQEIK